MVQVEDEVDAVEDAGAVLLPAWTSIEIILVPFIALLVLLIYLKILSCIFTDRSSCIPVICTPLLLLYKSTIRDWSALKI